MGALISAAISRLKEPSSWAAITAGLGTMGLAMPPGLAQSVAYIGMGVAGLAAFFMPEGGPKA